MDDSNLPVNTPLPYRRSSLLIVEDSDDHWFIIHWALLRTLPGVELIRTTDAEQTFAHLEACLAEGGRLPELILMDLYLPQREAGWSLLETLKQHHTYRRLPVIVISASDDPDDIEQSYYLRCTSYLVKPISADGWLTYFEDFRRYWWEAVTLPRPDGIAHPSGPADHRLLTGDRFNAGQS